VKSVAATRSIVDLSSSIAGVAPDAHRLQQARTRQLQAEAFDFQDQGAHVRRRAERLEVPLAQTAPGIECRFELAAECRIGAGNIEHY
jgi:hypothetical protein